MVPDVFRNLLQVSLPAEHFFSSASFPFHAKKHPATGCFLITLYIFHDFLTAIHALLIHYILYRLSLQKLYFQCLCQLLILPAASYRNPDILPSVRNLSRKILNQNLLFQKLLILRRQNPKAQSRHPIGL